MKKSKKIIGTILATIIGISVIVSTTKPVEAGYYVSSCCDDDGNIRCRINWVRIGTPCSCYGQGWGYSC